MRPVILCLLFVIASSRRVGHHHSRSGSSSADVSCKYELLGGRVSVGLLEEGGGGKGKGGRWCSKGGTEGEWVASAHWEDTIEEVGFGMTHETPHSLLSLQAPLDLPYFI